MIAVRQGQVITSRPCPHCGAHSCAQFSEHQPELLVCSYSKKALPAQTGEVLRVLDPPKSLAATAAGSAAEAALILFAIAVTLAIII